MTEQHTVRESVRDFVFDHIFAAMMAATIDKRSLAEQARECMEVVMNVVSSRWIPVGERLPDRDVDVLVAVHPCWAEKPYHEIGQWRTGDYWCVPDDASPVTHWMPLLSIPEPPATVTEQT